MAELPEQDNDFSRLMQELPFDDAPSRIHRDSLQRDVLSRFDRLQAASVSSPLGTFPRRPPKRMPWQDPRWIACAVVCLIVAAVWLFLPGQQRPAFAFHRLAAALVEAKTARFQTEVKVDGIPGQKFRSYYRSPGRFRQEASQFGTAAISIMDEPTGKVLTLIPATKTAIVMNAQGTRKSQASTDPFFQLRELLSRNRELNDSSFRPVGERQIDGKTAIGFTSETGLGECTLWGDPRTGHPIRIDVVWKGTRNETILSDFEINVDLDDGLFELTPPPDYKVQSFDVDVSKPGEEDLLGALRTCGEISSGSFPDGLGMVATTLFISRHLKSRLQKPSDEAAQQAIRQAASMNRGFRFAWDLPATADPHYAGKGVRQGTPDRPIFWYKPEGAANYRVIHADLTVHEVEQVPNVAGAVRLKNKNE